MKVSAPDEREKGTKELACELLAPTLRTRQQASESSPLTGAPSMISNLVIVSLSLY